MEEWHRHEEEGVANLLQQGIVQTLHQMGVFQITPEIFWLLDDFSSPLRRVLTTEQGKKAQKITRRIVEGGCGRKKKLDYDWKSGATAL